MLDQDPLKLVAYCGLYCGLCAQKNRIPRQAAQLMETLHEEGFDDFYKYVPEMKKNFPPFWKFLEELAKMDCSCKGEGGPSNCEIRFCAKEKGVDTCPFCDEYPCVKVQRLSEHYATLVQDGRRMRKIGIKKWVEEQNERQKRGFAYSDIRYPL